MNLIIVLAVVVVLYVALLAVQSNPIWIARAPRVSRMAHTRNMLAAERFNRYVWGPTLEDIENMRGQQLAVIEHFPAPVRKQRAA